MKKITLIFSIVTIIISLFSISYANNMISGAADGIRNMVGGAENMIENAGSAVGNAMQGTMNAVDNGAKNVSNATQNTIGAMTNDGNDNYTAERTTTTRTIDNNTDMPTNTYTWVIVGITAVGIGVLLWSFLRQNKENNIYIDSDDR